MELFESFGIEWKLLIAQVINFGVLVFILWKLVYRPLLKVLDERTEQAKDAEEKSNSVDRRLEEIKNLEEQTLAEARNAGQKLLKDAEISAGVLHKKLSEEASAHADKIVKDMQAKMHTEQAALRVELKKEIVNIVASALEVTVGKYLDTNAKTKLAEEASAEALKASPLVANTK